MDEIEILRGAKVRVTTQTITVGAKSAQVADVKSAAYIDADHQMTLTPKILLILGPILGAAVYLISLSFLYAMISGLVLMLAGLWFYRQTWLYQVSLTTTAAPTTIYRTPKKGDALLLHAAIEKALELRDNPTT
jgi:hypothetical protein